MHTHTCMQSLWLSMQIEANADQADALAEWNIPFEITLLADEDGIETVYHKNQDPETSSGNSIFRENSVSEDHQG